MPNSASWSARRRNSTSMVTRGRVCETGSTWQWGLRKVAVLWHLYSVTTKRRLKYNNSRTGTKTNFGPKLRQGRCKMTLTKVAGVHQISVHTSYTVEVSRSGLGCCCSWSSADDDDVMCWVQSNKSTSCHMCRVQSCRLQLQLCVSRYVTRISNSRYKSLVYCTPPLTSTDGRTRPSVMRRWLRLRLTWVQNENPWTQNYRLRYLLTTTLHCTALYSDVPLNRLGHKRQKCEGRSEDSCPLLAHSAIQCRLDCRLPTFSHYIKRYVHHVNRAKDKRHRALSRPEIHTLKLFMFSTVSRDFPRLRPLPESLHIARSANNRCE